MHETESPEKPRIQIFPRIMQGLLLASRCGETKIPGLRKSQFSFKVIATIAAPDKRELIVRQDYISTHGQINELRETKAVVISLYIQIPSIDLC
jgi:hypothetical protein